MPDNFLFGNEQTVHHSALAPDSQPQARCQENRIGQDGQRSSEIMRCAFKHSVLSGNNEKSHSSYRKWL